MNRAETLDLLNRHKAELQRRFGMRSMALFGSRDREQTRGGSDVDVLVDFDGPATSARYFGVQFYLEDLLGAPVDLVTSKALRPQLRPFIERDAMRYDATLRNIELIGEAASHVPEAVPTAAACRVRSRRSGRNLRISIFAYTRPNQPTPRRRQLIEAA